MKNEEILTKSLCRPPKIRESVAPVKIKVGHLVGVKTGRGKEAENSGGCLGPRPVIQDA